MSQFISFRNVTFHASTTGVRIIVTTDVPCHIYCRLSTVEPQIHPAGTVIRGLPGMDDYYYCFVAYEDNEQYEAGNTYVHTFWKTGWPVCTTKWCYFWGYVAGVISPSTSAVFKYHNDGVDPVVAPITLFVAAGHQALIVPSYADWKEILWADGTHLSAHLPANTKHLFIHVVRRAGRHNFSLRPYGSTFNTYRTYQEHAQFWAHVGVDSLIRAQGWLTQVGSTEMYLEGYAVGTAMVSLLNPIEVTPAIMDSWQTVNLATSCPGAKAILLSCLNQGGGWTWGARKYGSTDNRRNAADGAWPVVGCDSSQRIQLYSSGVSGYATRFWVWGYITQNDAFNTNATVLTMTPYSTWISRTVTPASKMVFIEIHNQDISWASAARQKGLTHNIYMATNGRHIFAMVGLNTDSQYEYKAYASWVHFYEVGSGY